MLGADLRLEAVDAESAIVLLTEQVGAPLDRGEVVVVDPLDAVDAWSRRVFDRVEDRGALVRVCSDSGDVLCGPLAPEDLRELFRGPDLVLHLREDGADLLHERTDGWPGRFATGIGGWVRPLLAHWDGDRVDLSAASIHRLRRGHRGPSRGHGGAPWLPRLNDEAREVLAWVELAWPHATLPVLAAATGHAPWRLDAALRALRDLGALTESQGRWAHVVAQDLALRWPEARLQEAHRRLAEVLGHDPESQVVHRAAAGDVAGVADLALRLSREAMDDGRLAEAEAAISEALAVARLAMAEDPVAPLLARYVEIACASNAEPWLRRADDALARAPRSEEQRRLAEIIRIWLDRPEDAEQRIEALGAFADPTLARLARTATVRAAQRRGTDSFRRAVRAQTPWAEAVGGEALATAATWQGHLSYREGNYRDAVLAHERAAKHAERRVTRLAAQLNAASAALEAAVVDDGALESVGRWVEEALQLAVSTRNPIEEARARWLARAAPYRAGRDLEPDLDFVAAVRLLGRENTLAVVLLQEAAFGWRRAEGPWVDLATEAAAAFARNGQSGPAWLAHLLAAQGGARAERPPEPVGQSHDPVVAAQCLALAARCGLDCPAALGAAAPEAEPVLRRARVRRLDVLGPEEILSALR